MKTLNKKKITNNFRSQYRCEFLNRVSTLKSVIAYELRQETINLRVIGRKGEYTSIDKKRLNIKLFLYLNVLLVRFFGKISTNARQLAAFTSYYRLRLC